MRTPCARSVTVTLVPVVAPLAGLVMVTPPEGAAGVAEAAVVGPAETPIAESLGALRFSLQAIVIAATMSVTASERLMDFCAPVFARDGQLRLERARSSPYSS